MILQGFADFQRAFHRRGGVVKENQRHAVAGGNARELLALSRLGDFGGIAHQLLQRV